LPNTEQAKRFKYETTEVEQTTHRKEDYHDKNKSIHTYTTNSNNQLGAGRGYEAGYQASVLRGRE
jgi:hypothetical protein